MTFDNVVRLVMCVVFGLLGGVCVTRAVWRRGEPVVALMLVTLAVFAATFLFGQVSLFNQPFTVRTFASGVSAIVGVCFMVALFMLGPPKNPQP